MDDFPNSDEEFELMYGDDLDVLREQLDDPRNPRKSRKSLHFQSDAPSTSNKENDVSIGNVQDSFENDFVPISLDESLTEAEPSTNNDITKKRTIAELFGDIDDILYDSTAKKHKSNAHDEDLSLIEQILAMRKLAQQKAMPDMRRNYTTITDQNRNNLSYSVPRYPFVAITRHDGTRIYIRCHSQDYEQEDTQRIIQEIGFKGVLGDNSEEIWQEANNLVNRQVDEIPNTEVTVSQAVNADKDLWVDLYKPRKYSELLSDESTNRIMLKWLKLWDKVVFNRNPRIKSHKPDVNHGKFQPRQELCTDLEPDGRPRHKVALMCGCPGLGKTTLAHMVARHAGYNVVELNASDDRSIEAFKTSLENATQMRSVLDREKRPNCLIFDEIDGAPPSSIEFLVKFITGAAMKGKKGKKHSNILKRPIICICNDVYTPALRPLRQIAFVVNFPPTSHTRLAERLMEIARRQLVQTDRWAMLALAQKSNNDIRSCLSMLHFFKSQSKPVTLHDVINANLGQKDMQRGLFSVWQDIFLIERPKRGDDFDLGQAADLGVKGRMQKVLQVVQSFGDYERLAQGVFENYPKIQYKSSDMDSTCHALEWFSYSDLMNKTIYSLQDYSLMVYLPYAFVVWHFTFATTLWQKLQYPNVGYEVRMRQNRRKAIVAELMRGMQATIRTQIQPIALLIDILPLLSIIITPSFRPISLHLYTAKERKCLDHVVSVMADYNLNYIQERTPEGNYIYKMDPNIEEIADFGPRRSLSYLNKQLVAKEIDTLKMHRFEPVKSGGDDVVKKAPPLPNHLQTLPVRSVGRIKTPAVNKRDFFGRIIQQEEATNADKAGTELANDVCFHYKEGYSNAVRKQIYISCLK